MLEFKKISKYKTFSCFENPVIKTPTDEFFDIYNDGHIIEFASRGTIARIGTWHKLRRTYFCVFKVPEYYK